MGEPPSEVRLGGDFIGRLIDSAASLFGRQSVAPPFLYPLTHFDFCTLSYTFFSVPPLALIQTAQPLERAFFARNPRRVARELLGKVLMRDRGKLHLSARIVEVEAYLGESDPAAHAAAGTPPAHPSCSVLLASLTFTSSTGITIASMFPASVRARLDRSFFELSNRSRVFRKWRERADLW